MYGPNDDLLVKDQVDDLQVDDLQEQLAQAQARIRELERRLEEAMALFDESPMRDEADEADELGRGLIEMASDTWHTLGYRRLKLIRAALGGETDKRLVCTPEERAVLDAIKAIPQDWVERCAAHGGDAHPSNVALARAELARRAAKGGG